MRQGALFLVWVMLWAASCVPNKKVVYLQDEEYPSDYPKNQEMASYELTSFEYLLQPNDVLRVQIKSVLPENDFDFFDDIETGMQGGMMQGGGMLLAGYIIDREGYIELPIVGKLKVDSLTVEQATEKISREVKLYVDAPVVKVNLLSFQYSVVGEISTPGIYYNYLPQLTIFQAISDAGDLTQFADRKNIKIIRMNGSEATTLYVNLLDEELLASANYFVRPGDLIIVPPLKAKPFRQYVIPNVGFVLSLVGVYFVIESIIN